MMTRRPPPDEGLRDPVRKFEDTFSGEKVVMDHFFPKGGKVSVKGPNDKDFREVLSTGDFECSPETLRRYGPDLLMALNECPPRMDPATFDRIVAGACPRCGQHGVCQCLGPSDPTWDADAPARVCRYPDTSDPARYTCRCHKQLGNDYYFLPADRCLWDDEPVLTPTPRPSWAMAIWIVIVLIAGMVLGAGL